MKKKDLPYMPFYVGDWRKCPEVRALSLPARALWFEMLCLMWESNRRGYLEISGNPITDEILGRMVGEHTETVKVLLDEIERNNVFSREEKTQIIYNRRMVFDESLRVSRSKAGTKGMKVRYNKNRNKNITPPDNDNDNDIISLQWYLMQEQEAYNKILSDLVWIEERERYHPNLNVRLSLEKAHKDFWGTEAGYKHKRKSRTKKIDWPATFANALSLKSNQVWKLKNEQNSNNDGWH